MRLFLISLLAIIGINVSAQTNLQYQAHVPFRASTVQFSAYLADSLFNEDSHINTTAFWYVEGVTQEVNNGIINVVLENIPDSVFGLNEGNLFVYGYVNGQSLGRLPVYPVPYSRFSNHANTSRVSGRAEQADFAVASGFADTSGYAHNAGYAASADSSNFANRASEADVALTSLLAAEAAYAVQSDTARYAYLALYAEGADSATYATVSGIADVAESVVNNAIKLQSIDGHVTAPIGSVLSRGNSGLSWVLNPQYYANPTDIAIITTVPVALPNARWIVSRVAVNYNIVAPTAPVAGQLITVTNGSTANRVTLDGAIWSLDNGNSYQIAPGGSKTLYFDGNDWIIIQ